MAGALQAFVEEKKGGQETLAGQVGGSQGKERRTERADRVKATQIHRPRPATPLPGLCPGESLLLTCQAM